MPRNMPGKVGFVQEPTVVYIPRDEHLWTSDSESINNESLDEEYHQLDSNEPDMFVADNLDMQTGVSVAEKFNIESEFDLELLNNPEALLACFSRHQIQTTPKTFFPEEQQAPSFFTDEQEQSFEPADPEPTKKSRDGRNWELYGTNPKIANQARLIVNARKSSESLKRKADTTPAITSLPEIIEEIDMLQRLIEDLKTEPNFLPPTFSKQNLEERLRKRLTGMKAYAIRIQSRLPDQNNQSEPTKQSRAIRKIISGKRNSPWFSEDEFKACLERANSVFDPEKIARPKDTNSWLARGRSSLELQWIGSLRNYPSNV